MTKRLFYIFGILNYLIVLGLFLYLVGFVNNWIVPKSIDSGEPAGLLPSIAFNMVWVGLFALQHSIMARPVFKKRWMRIIPKAIERSTYLLFTITALVLMIWLWQPMPQIVWKLTNPYIQISLWIFNGLGWLLIFISTRLINSAHFFGLQQVKEHMRDKTLTAPQFQTPGFYQYTRHPMMLGFLMAFWITPEMSMGRLFFALLMTIYIILGVRYEEKDLIGHFGNRYRAYRQQVSMLIPGFRIGLKRKTPSEKPSAQSH
ncbi:MAG: isoprenylcysteine carboxylmethyltransferase family protein [Caldithrix sp.]|nr:isoprenylcysteine carboxylmethyltransferase family protein [Caldithrix sp.]